VNFQDSGYRHLGCFEVKFDVSGSRGRPVSHIGLHTKFGEDISEVSRVMAIYVFSKWRAAAILDFGGT